MNTNDSEIPAGDVQPAEIRSIPKQKKRRLQLSLWSLLLLIAACGVWIAYRKAKSDIAEIQAQLPSLRLIARVLVVEDATQFAAVKRFPRLWDENVWDVYVPEVNGKRVELLLQMDEVPDGRKAEASQLAPIHQSVLLSGKHIIEFRYRVVDEQVIAKAIVDGETVIEEIRPKDWVISDGFGSASSVSSESKSFKLDSMIRLLHRRFMVTKPDGSSSSQDGPCPGILLWIKCVEETETVNSES